MTELRLGDIVQITAPNDSDINEHIYHIVYIDEDKLRLEEADGHEETFTLTDGYWDNEAIENIRIKSRAEEVGYAKQNNLLNGVWIDVHFSGDLPLILTGKITNTEEDKIEVTTFPENEVIFIDFQYKGLPEDLPIDKIQIRKAPDVSMNARESKPVPAPLVPDEPVPVPAPDEPVQEIDSASTEALEKKYNEIQKQLLEMPEEEVTDENLEFTKQKEIQEETRNSIYNADQMQFGEDLEAITQRIDVPEEEQRYDIDKQLDDLLDDMLSTIPNAQRTNSVKNNVHKMIERFKQLRDKFSIFNDKGYALMPKIHGPQYKPLVSVMEQFEKQLYWMLPVVKTIKKIYNSEEKSEGGEESILELGADDIELLSFAEDATAATTIVDAYETNTEMEGNRYAALQKKLNPFFTPFLEPTNKEAIIVSKDVNATITALVDNLGNFNSSVQGTDTFTSPHSPHKYERERKIQQKRFAFQNYTIGATGLDITKVRGDNPIIKRKELTKNDHLDLTSILMLPQAAVRFSRVNLHAPSILDKSNLNLHFLNYWQALQETTRVKNTMIDNLTRPYEHNSETFLKQIRNFRFNGSDTDTEGSHTKGSHTADTEGSHTEGSHTYNSFLNTVIPKTKFLFNAIKPYIVGKLSINDILTYLEPFMIYHDDLNANQYKEMTAYISEKIIDYRRKYAAKSREYASIKGTQNVILPSLIKILDENTNLRTKVLDVYGFSDTIMTMTNADFIKRIYAIDGGVFYNNAIALISTNLMIADGTRDMADIDIYLNAEKQNGISTKKAVTDTGKAATGKAATGRTKKTATEDGGITSNCNKYKVIAKRYIEIDELNEDNGKEIFFDKKYDPTNYSNGELFKADATLPINEQIQHYIGKLMKMKGIDELNARREAESFVKGKRIVEDGEYAILETTSETSATVQYYVRKNEQWILDDTIDAETFADDMKMFCNLNEKCIAVKDKCEDEASGANELKKHNLKLLLAEFNTALNANKDIIMNKIEDELGRADARIEILRNLRLVKMYAYETKKIEIGNTVEETKKVVVSPYDGLLNNVLSQADMTKRYLDISNFVKSFTREGLPENDESSYWLYCVKSGKKMLPTFISTLATTFLTGGDFVLMLNKICALQGTISDDGDKYVDKYSGYTIKMIEMSTDEEYNEEGFKIITRAVMEEDVGDVVTDALNSLPRGVKPTLVKRNYATPDATAIYNVIEALAKNMGLNITDQKDFIVRNVLKQLSNTSVMPSKTTHEKLYALMMSKGKPFDTYEVAYNSVLMYLTFAYYLIAIQTSVPPIKTKTTFPGCKKSFGGFPIDGTDTTNTTGLNYIACVAFKLKNKTTLPWSAIASRTDTFIAKQMEVLITKHILPTEEVQHSIKTLNLYLIENPESTSIPVEHRVENWLNFLPPLKQLKMATTQDVGDVFKDRLSDSLRKGQKVQAEYIAELQSKMILFSFHIIDLIEKTVHGEQAILRGKSGEPYLENACCEIGENNTIKYFVKKRPEIGILNNKVVRLSDIYEDTKKLSKAVLLYDPSNTKRKLREIENKFSEHTIYRAFIVYCKFNSLIPLTDNLKAICPTKPDHFDFNDTLDESIRKLKSNARNYSEQSLQQLLNIINSASQVAIKSEEKVVTNVDKLAEIMAQLDSENKRPSAFRQDFMNVLETFEINALLEDTAQLRKFKNLLPKLNDDMLAQINEFIGSYSVGAKKVNLRDFKECLVTILQFKQTGNNLILGQKEETGYKMINFMKKAMRSLTREFPNIIMNEINYNSVNAPSHWELSLKHQGDVKEIIKGHYSEFAPFYKDGQIKLMMQKMIELTSDVNAMAQNTLCYAPVELKTKGSPDQSREQSTQQSTQQSSEQASSFKYSAFDLDLTTLLFKFYFLNVLTDLISLQNDKDILGLPLKQLETDMLENAEEEESFMSKANEMDILAGNKTELAEKIAAVIISFTNFICKDKRAIDYNYKSLMELILRSKEKEKDEITDYLGKMTVEERAVENLFKTNKLGRWSKGEQKGIHTYDTSTYDQEREEMEKIATQEASLNKRSVVTDMNRDIFRLDMLNEEATATDMEREDNIITYMGQDEEPEDYDMDGDENFY